MMDISTLLAINLLDSVSVTCGEERGDLLPSFLPGEGVDSYFQMSEDRAKKGGGAFSRKKGPP